MVQYGGGACDGGVRHWFLRLRKICMIAEGEGSRGFEEVVVVVLGEDERIM